MLTGKNCTFGESKGNLVAYSKEGLPSQIYQKVKESGLSEDEAIKVYEEFLDNTYNILGNAYAKDAAGEPVLDEIKDFIDIPFSYTESNKLRPDQVESANTLKLIGRDQARSYLSNEGRYFYDDKQVKLRTSETTSKPFYAKKFKNIQKNFEDTDSANVGTIIHEYNYFILQALIDGKDLSIKDYAEFEAKVKNALKDRVNPETGKNELANLDASFYNFKKFFPLMIQGVKAIKEDIEEKGKTRGGVTILPEIRLYDPVIDQMGTGDVVAVFGNNETAVYDYKTMRMPFEKVGTGRNTKFELSQEASIKNYKQQAFGKQLGRYGEMLVNNYGAKQNIFYRIIPIPLSFTKEEKTYTRRNGQVVTVGKGTTTMMEFNHKSDKAILRELSVADEKTGNAEVDNVLSIINKRIEITAKRIEDKFYSEEDTSELEDLLKTMQEARQKTILERRITPLIEGTLAIIQRLEYDLVGTDVRALNEGIKLITSIQTITQAMRNIENQRVAELKMLVTSRIDDYLFDAQKRLMDLIQSQTGQNLQQTVKEGDWTLQFDNRRSVNHPIIQAQTFYIDKALQEIYERTEALNKELVEWKKRFKEKGIDQQEFFESMIDERRNLVSQLESRFYDDTKTARSNQDVKWLRENFELKENYVELYEKKKASQKAYLDALYKPTQSKAAMAKYQAELDKWEKKEDLRLPTDTAWLNGKNAFYLQPSKKAFTEYTTEQYKTVANDALKLEFYDWYRDKNKEFAKLMDKQFAYNFTASTKKTLIDKFVEAQGGGDLMKALISQPREFIESLEVEEEMEGYNTENSVPIYYMRKVLTKQREADIISAIEQIKNDTTTSTEEKDELLKPLLKEKASGLRVEDKSTDLLQSMLLFGNMAYRVNQMKQVEAYMDSLRYILAEKPQYTTDRLGNLLKDMEGNLKAEKGNTRYLEYFDAMVSFYIFGKAIDSKDATISIFGKNLSALKIFGKAHSYLSRKALAGNFVSASAGAVSAMFNAHMYGRKGQYFNTEQLSKAMKKMAKHPIAYFKAMEYFKVDDDNWTAREAASLQDSWFKRNLISSSWYIVQRLGEAGQLHSTSMAMMQNYGIDSKGKLKKISLLPEGSESLWDITKMESGEPDFSVIPRDVFHQFRQYSQHVTTKIKGSVSANNRSEAEGKLWALAVFKFRNWIPGMLKERFQNLNYEPMTDEYEIGRYRAVTNAVFDLWKVKQDAFQGNLLEYATTVGLSLFREDSRVKMTEAVVDKLYENYRKNNPDSILFQKVESGEMAEYEAKQRVLEIVQGQLRAAATELKTIMAVGVMLFLMGFDYDDDGEPDYKKVFLTRWIKSYADRLFNELTFFISPRSTEEILKSPIPILALLSDFQNFGLNTLDEFRDSILGENSDNDQKGFFAFTANMIPLLRYPINVFRDIMDDFDTDKKKRKTPKKGSREIDIN